jgi:hypothetical protein
MRRYTISVIRQSYADVKLQIKGVFASSHRMLSVIGQALEGIVSRGTDIYAFAPMEDWDRAQVRIIQYVFCYG